MLADSLLKKILNLIQFLALVGLSCQVSYGRLNNSVSSIARYAELRISFSLNGYYPALENIFQSSMRVNSTMMGVVGPIVHTMQSHYLVVVSVGQLHSWFGCSP